MVRRLLIIDVGPTGELYHSLLRVAARWCTQALLVVRAGLGLSNTGAELIRQLQPFVVEESEQASWPGTTLLDGTATVLRFRTDPAAVSLLLAYSSGLYDWHQPNLPEDLCLLREGGDAWLVTIAHEHDSFVVVSDAELEALRRELPAFTALLVKDVDA